MVNLTESAEADLLEIYKYVYFTDSQDAADMLYQKLFSTCTKLQNYATRGHIPPELRELGVEDFLEIHYKPYRIIYKIFGKEVFVYCIVDGRRDMQKLLQERLIRS